MKYIRVILSATVALGLTLWAGYFLWTHPPQLPDLSSISSGQIAAIAISGQLFLIFQGLLIRETLIPLGITLPFKQWYGTLNVTLLGNYIFPFAGIGFRAKYLHSMYGLSFGDFATSLLLMYPVQIVVFSFWGSCALVLAYFQVGYVEPLLWLMVPGVTISPVILIFAAPRIPFIARIKKIERVLNQWRKLGDEPALSLRLFTQASLMYFAAALFMYSSYNALGYDLSAVGSALIASVANVTSFIKIAPAAIGSYDAAIIFVGHGFNIDTNQSVLIATLTRAFLMIWFFILGPIFAAILSKEIISKDMLAKDKAEPTTP